MKKMLSSIAAVTLCVPAHASPEIMGLKGGVGSSIQSLGTPSPTPTPGAALVPGSTPIGSWTATSTPGKQGNSGEPLYNTNIILAWDMVPRQPLTSADNQVCVMAFHAPTPTEYSGGARNAVEKVTFIANNGTAVDVMTPTSSNRSGKPEYCIGLDQSGLGSNATVEIRAIGYPTTGQPVVLQGDDDLPFFDKYYSLFVVGNYSPTRYYVDDGGSDSGNNCTNSGSPCQTIARVKTVLGAIDYSNIEVCLGAGTYNLDSGSTQRPAATGFFTVRPCPGVSKSSVIINGWGISNDGVYVDRSRIQEVTVSGVTAADPPDTSFLWLDNVDWAGGCRGVNTCVAINQFNSHALFATDVNWSDLYNPIDANAVLFRNVNMDLINSDYGQNVRFIVNGLETNVQYCCGAHPDLNQSSNAQGGNGHIVYGLTAVNSINQAGLFSSNSGILTDAAFVDVTIDDNSSNRAGWQFDALGTNDNVFVWNLNLTTAIMPGDSMTPTNWNIVDSVCTTAIGSRTGFTFLGSSTCD